MALTVHFKMVNFVMEILFQFRKRICVVVGQVIFIFIIELLYIFLIFYKGYA